MSINVLLFLKQFFQFNLYFLGNRHLEHFEFVWPSSRISNLLSGSDSGFISGHPPMLSAPLPAHRLDALDLLFICTEMYNFSESNVNTFSVFLWDSSP